ncbi:MAG: hypothetical protein EBR02_06810 [Alphaproteobacteria bacterium]|nr:hypothetical protein [Alphaproteobacteria bacterium]
MSKYWGLAVFLAFIIPQQLFAADKKADCINSFLSTNSDYVNYVKTRIFSNKKSVEQCSRELLIALIKDVLYKSKDPNICELLEYEAKLSKKAITPNIDLDEAFWNVSDDLVDSISISFDSKCNITSK